MGTTLHEARAGTIDVNGASLYHELRGDGPALVLISGATGDAGHFAAVGPVLADGFTVVTYDRRGNSRSRPDGRWMPTTIDEQADDCAALIRALGLAPALVFGTSGGAIVLLDLLLRRPEVVRGAIVHEPPIVAVTSDPQTVGSELQEMVERELANGGPRGAMEAFVRWAAGDGVFEALEPGLRERMMSNGEVFFGTELEAFVGFVPTPEQLAAVRVPVVVAAGEDNRSPESSGRYLYEASEWIAGRLATAAVEAPDGHVPYFTDPERFAIWLRPILERLARGDR